jgi:hypothetical protein
MEQIENDVADSDDDSEEDQTDGGVSITGYEEEA